MALAINRPLLGQRTAELLDILETLDAEEGGKKPPGFHVVGRGRQDQSYSTRRCSMSAGLSRR